MVTASLMQSPLWLIAGWVMLHFLWVGLGIGVVAAAGRWLLHPNPRLRYIFALACFGALAVAPGLIVVFVTPNIPTEAALSGPLIFVEPPAPPNAFSVAAIDQETPAAAPGIMLDAVARFLPWLWLIGAPIMLLMVASGLIGSERLRRQSRRLNGGDVAASCRRLAESLGVFREVAVGTCSRLAAPILIGILKPMILLPPIALTSWSAAQLEMVLLHELAHVRRWDSLVNLLQRIVEAILFFHPVVWLLSAWIRLEREMCCDQIVVERTGNPHVYAETLAGLAAPDAALRAGALAMTEHRLVARIRRILNLEDRSMKTSSKSLGVAVVLLAVAAIGIAVYTQATAMGQAADDADAREAAKQPEPNPNDASKHQDEGNRGAERARSETQKIAGQKQTNAKDEAKQSPPISHVATVEAYQQVQLFSRVAGTVKSISVDIGDRVKKGQVLVVLDAPELELELKQKRAMVDQAKAEQVRATNSVRAAQAALEAARALAREADAGAKSAKANHNFRKAQFQRMQELYKNKSIEDRILDEARERLEAAQEGQVASEAKAQALKAMVEESAAKVESARLDVVVAEARVAVAQADAQRTEGLLQSAQIRAPFDGVITRRTLFVGDFAPAAGQGNAKPLVTIAQTDRVRIIVELPEATVAQISTGTPAVVRCTALAGKQFQGKVSRLAQAFDAKTRTLRAEIDLPNPDGRLLPGMYGTVTFKGSQ